MFVTISILRSDPFSVIVNLITESFLKDEKSSPFKLSIAIPCLRVEYDFVFSFRSTICSTSIPFILVTKALSLSAIDTVYPFPLDFGKIFTAKSG